jgi:hypothetical protein
MEIKDVYLDNPKTKAFYDGLLAHMREQYKDVVSIDEAHINANKKVFSAQWRDSKGVIHFCAGYVPECVKVIRFNEKKVDWLEYPETV